MEDNAQEALIRQKAVAIYRRHGLNYSASVIKDKVDKVVGLCKQEVKRCPEIEISNFFLMQMILENF